MNQQLMDGKLERREWILGVIRMARAKTGPAGEESPTDEELADYALTAEVEGTREVFFAGFDAATSDAGLGFYATETRERHYQSWLKVAPALERCDTTLTERLPRDSCSCDAEEYTVDSMGPCQAWRLGQNGRCVYCDHTKSCHSQAPEAQ